MTYIVETYYEGCDRLSDQPTESEEFEGFIDALAHACGVAVSRYKASDINVWVDEEEIGPNGMAFYEPGQNGNVVFRRVD